MGLKGVTAVLVLFLVFYVESKPIDEIQAILEGVPENERIPFLKTHIKIGHDLSEGRDSGAGFDESEQFSLSVYNLMRKNYSIQDEEQLKVLREIICFDDGVCIDIGDTGIHPK